MLERNKAIVIRWIDEMCGKRDLSVGDEIFAVDLIDHNPVPDQMLGVEGQKQILRDLWFAFPDFHTEAEGVIAEGDLVVVRWVATGTHQNEYYGIAPTGKTMVYRGIDVVRLEGGKIVERWGISDDYGLLQQLGAI